MEARSGRLNRSVFGLTDCGRSEPQRLGRQLFHAWYSVGAAALMRKLSDKRVAAARTRQTEQILDYAIGNRFCVPLLHKIGVQLAHRQPPGLADRLCLLHTGISGAVNCSSLTDTLQDLQINFALLQLTVGITDNLLVV